MQKRSTFYFFFGMIWILGIGYLFIQSYKSIFSSEIGFCIFKKITSFPCPSCGSTRSVLEILNYNFREAFFLNPFGYIIFSFLVFFPFVFLIDILFHKNYFQQFYFQLEKIIKQKRVYIILIIIVFLNWIWNINKQL